MDFSLSEEQQLLKDSVQRFVREEYELDTRRTLVASDIGYSEENWKKMGGARPKVVCNRSGWSKQGRRVTGDHSRTRNGGG